MNFFPPFPNSTVKDWPFGVIDWFKQLRSSFTSLLTKAVGGSANINLTDDESRAKILEFTGVLTGNINVIVATITQSWIVKNGTTGAFTLTVKTSGGTGIVVATGKRAILYCDGTNVVRVTADT